MLSDLAPALHLASGAAALALGPLALYAVRRWSRGRRVADAYHWAVLAVCVSAVLLAALDWSRLWWFLPLAGGSYALALLGYLAARRRGPGWLRLQVHGQGGSYIALVTALLVVSAGSPLAWVAPTLIGSPLVARASRRAQGGPHVEAGASTSRPWCRAPAAKRAS